MTSSTIKSSEPRDSWRSEARKKLYRSKLLHVLQRVRLGSSGPVHSVRLRGLAIRTAADRVLAMTAKGRSLWSGAILTNQLNGKCINNLRRRGVNATANKRNVWLRKHRVGGLRLRTRVQRKARELRRLVPGCWKQPLAVVLEEVMDYVSALDMQVKVMAAVADRLYDESSSGSGFVDGAVGNVGHVGVSR